MRAAVGPATVPRRAQDPLLLAIPDPALIPGSLPLCRPLCLVIKRQDPFGQGPSLKSLFPHTTRRISGWAARSRLHHLKDHFYEDCQQANSGRSISRFNAAFTGGLGSKAGKVAPRPGNSKNPRACGLNTEPLALGSPEEEERTERKR